MARNEKTSPRVARIAAKVLAIKTYGSLVYRKNLYAEKINDFVVPATLWRDIRALAASCLTQAADKPKAKRKHAP